MQPAAILGMIILHAKKFISPIKEEKKGKSDCLFSGLKPFFH